MGAYTDPALFDLSAAVESLPAMHQVMHQTGDSGVHRMSTDVNQEGDGIGPEERVVTPWGA